MSLNTRAFLNEQLQILQTSHHVANLIEKTRTDQDSTVPDRAVSAAVKRLNIKLKENMQTTLGKQAQRSLLEQLEALQSQKSGGAVCAVGTQLSDEQEPNVMSHFPNSWPKNKVSTSSTSRKYTALRAGVAKKTEKLAALRRNAHHLRTLVNIVKPLKDSLSPAACKQLVTQLKRTQVLTQSLCAADSL
eukprot:m.46702 g.46702  ORF g.46702 m.46702 type:complete len:189 (-) comp20311_c0_seq3:245-811(-)